MKISFVIAVYRNAGAITETYKKIKSVFHDDLKDFKYEIIFVDDGSDDGSLVEILQLRDLDSGVKAISFTRNFGQMAAMLAGFKEAKGKAIVNISADLQDPISLVSRMVEQWQKGAEIVICNRIQRSDDFVSKIFSKIAYGILKITTPQIPTGGFDFVLMDRTVMDTFNSIEVRNRFFQGDLLWPGYRVAFIPYVRLKRTIGRSQYSFAKKLKNFLDAILDTSYLPIRFISFCGIITSILGVIYSFTIVVSWLLGKAPFSGWAPIMMAILLIGGMIMFMLGIIGEYIWRIYDEVRGKPNYIIRSKYL